MARREQRNAEDPRIPVSSAQFAEFFGMGTFGPSAAGVTVTIDTAMTCPAVWGAVNFLSSTLSAFPLHIYRRKGAARERVRGYLADRLHESVNDEETSYNWRKHLWTQVFTGGRAFTFIERNGVGKITHLWSLDPNGMRVRRVGGRKRYEYRDGTKPSVYGANEIVDIPFMLKANGLDHRGPINSNRDVIGMAIAATQYASKFFQGGGVPPFAVTGQFASPAAMKRASEDLADAVRRSAKEQRQALVLPQGLEIKPIGVDPEKSQLVEAQRFIIEQIARIYSIPPLFLQDLSKLSYSNAEQQDLHLAKHTLSGWVKQFEQELNLKLFGWTSNTQFVECNMDSIVRGDFKTRMEGLSRAVAAGLLTPNEGRRTDNREDKPGGDRLFMQGAMMPLDSIGQSPKGAPPPQGEINDDA